MSVTRAALTDIDLRTLLKGATADERAVAAHKLCRVIDRAALDDEEREQAQDILRVMAADAAELVRRALAVTLKSSDILPRDVALRLAKDVESICLPVLNFSPAFTDDDLTEIVRLGGPVRQVAIAKRPRISEKVTAAIVELGVEQAVETVCANDNATFSERTLQSALDRFEKSERVLAAVAYRNALPLAVTERLIDMVGDQVRDHLLNNHALSPEVALQIAVGAKERATVDLVDQAGRAADPKAFAAHLHKAERLTASLLLRALAHGHMTFFECGLAELAGVPHHRTWLMVHDAGPLGLRAIYERAGLPTRLFGAFRAGVDTWHSMEFDGGLRDKERFQERMLQRFLTQPQSAGRDDVDYLIERMDRLSRQGRSAANVA
ncbi:MAG TPA: pole-localized protein SpbR [Caulobacter sp.]|nr:pole-localized protein SpbR [Caulobacter sp.]